MLSARWGHIGKAVCAQMNALWSWLETPTGNLPVPSTSPRLPEGLRTLLYMYYGMDRVLHSIFEKHIVSHVLILWKDGLITLSLLPARPVSRSWKAIREVSCLLFKSI